MGIPLLGLLIWGWALISISLDLSHSKLFSILSLVEKEKKLYHSALQVTTFMDVLSFPSFLISNWLIPFWFFFELSHFLVDTSQILSVTINSATNTLFLLHQPKAGLYQIFWLLSRYGKRQFNQLFAFIIAHIVFFSTFYDSFLVIHCLALKTITYIFV